jgi:hypothetical protein
MRNIRAAPMTRSMAPTQQRPEWVMDQIAPELWVHGHVHAWHDYGVGSTRVTSRPMGYFGETVPVGRMEMLDAA